MLFSYFAKIVKKDFVFSSIIKHVVQLSCSEIQKFEKIKPMYKRRISYNILRHMKTKFTERTTGYTLALYKNMLYKTSEDEMDKEHPKNIHPN